MKNDWQILSYHRYTTYNQMQASFTQLAITAPKALRMLNKGTIPSSRVCGKYVAVCEKIAEEKRKDLACTFVYLSVVELWQIDKKKISETDVERVAASWIGSNDYWVFVGNSEIISEMHLYEFAK